MHKPLALQAKQLCQTKVIVQYSVTSFTGKYKVRNIKFQNIYIIHLSTSVGLEDFDDVFNDLCSYIDLLRGRLFEDRLA